MAAETWIDEAEDLDAVGFFGTMSGIGGPRVTAHVTVSPSGHKTGDRDGWFEAMHRVLTGKKAESHVLIDPVTDKMGQYGPLDRSARSLARSDGALPYSHNKVGTRNIQIEFVAQPDDFTRYWKPGPNLRALGRAIASHGIPAEAIYRCAMRSSERAAVVRPNRLLTSAEGGRKWWGHCHYGDGESHWDPAVNWSRFFAGMYPATPAPPPVKPTPTVPMEEHMLLLVRINSTDPDVRNPVLVIDDLMTARHVPDGAAMNRITKAVTGTYGKTPAVQTVDRLDGLAARWIGPVPPPSDATGKPYPIPAGWLS